MSLHRSPRVPLWGRFETSLRHPRPPADPYGLTLEAQFTSPAGRETEVEGFYDGDDAWRLRFMPDELGTWTYRAKLADDAATTEGSFVACPGPIPGLVDRDAGNPMWFGYRGGRRLLVRGFHVGDRFFASNWAEEKRRRFLDWCGDQGYNLLSMASHYLNRDQEERGRDWQTPALWPLNAAEFSRMETVLDDLAARGILVYPFAGFFGQASNYPREAEAQARYVRYVIARLGSYWNLLFNVAGPEPNVGRGWMAGSDVYRLGALIAEVDSYGHLLSVHNRTGDDVYKDWAWTTYGILQGPKTTDQQTLAEAQLRNHHPDKPLLAQETLWSGNILHIRRTGRDYSHDDVRRSAYVMGMTAAGLVYADHDGKSSSGFSGDMEVGRQKQSKHDVVRMVWDFFETVPFYLMRPCPERVSRGHCLEDDGHRLLVYVTGGGPLTVDVDGTWRGEWIGGDDPYRRVDAGVVASDSALSTPDEDGDWLLSLRRVGESVPDQVHLSWVEDPARSLTVSWHTAAAADSSVAWRQLGERTWQQQPAQRSASPHRGVLHRATITGLQPATPYEYRPSGGAVQRARTAPASGDFTFAFLSDTGLIGRPDGNATGTRQVCNELLKDDPLFILGGGDYAYGNKDGRYQEMGEAVDAWFQQSEELLSRHPFMAQYGNHEIHLEERFEDWAPRFAHPAGFDEGRSYSFRVGEVHFTALFVPGRQLSDGQLGWLRDDLAAARAAARWLVVFQHESIYGHGTSHPARPEVRSALAPIFEEHRVDLHLSAHDQNYERTFPLTDVPAGPTVQSMDPARYRKGDGVVYAKVSPAGKMSEIGNRFSQLPADQPGFIAVSDDMAHHYCLVSLREDGAELALRAYSVVGDGSPKSLLDEFVIAE